MRVFAGIPKEMHTLAEHYGYGTKQHAELVTKSIEAQACLVLLRHLQEDGNEGKA
jgi:hypothetical protein